VRLPTPGEQDLVDDSEEIVRTGATGRLHREPVRDGHDISGDACRPGVARQVTPDDGASEASLEPDPGGTLGELKVSQIGFGAMGNVGVQAAGDRYERRSRGLRR
jgi:hypothetical protein